MSEKFEKSSVLEDEGGSDVEDVESLELSVVKIVRKIKMSFG